MGKIYCIPDVHGEIGLLQEALLTLYPIFEDGTDKIIFMGDLIDRGPSSKQVLDTVMELSYQDPNIIVLRGNHEQFMINTFRNKRIEEVQIWFHPGNGGSRTIANFGTLNEFWETGERYVNWLESLPLFHEEPGFFFSHAPLPKEKDREKPGIPFTNHEYIWTYFDHEEGKSRVHENKVGVCGHIHKLRSGIFGPRFYGHYLFLDAGAGCHPRAPLVVTEVTERKTFWVWPDKPIRSVGNEKVQQDPRVL